jgi:signal transduction histidine kinase
VRRRCWVAEITTAALARPVSKTNPAPSTPAPAPAPTFSHERIGPDRGELERRLREAERALAEAGTQARKIAHDLNNVLTGIVGYQELVIELLPGGDQARFFLGEARDSCLRARALVEQLGTLGRRDGAGAPAGEPPLP